MKRSFDVDANADSYALVPEGIRVLVVEEIVDEKTSIGGNTVFTISLEDVDTGLHMRHWQTMIPKGNPGHGLSIKWLKALGYDIPSDGQMNYDECDWVGKVVKGLVTHEDYTNSEGKQRRSAKLDVAHIEPFGSKELPNHEDDNPFA